MKDLPALRQGKLGQVLLFMDKDIGAAAFLTVLGAVLGFNQSELPARLRRNRYRVKIVAQLRSKEPV